MTALATDGFRIADEAYRRGLRPEPQMTVSQWADANRILPQGTAEPGPWRTARVPYLAGIMDALSVSSPVERVVFMKAAQLGGTEAGLNWIGYAIAHAPGPMMLVMPSIDMIRRNTRTRIDPLLEETPALKGLVVPQRTREPGNTMNLKEFAGGQLVMTGANAPTGLRSTAIRYLFCDEVDGYPADADGEGDPVALAVQRTATFRGRRKVFLCSTPTLKGASRIETAYAESDQRRFVVRCPQCGAPFALTWEMIHWPDDDPARAFAVCPAAGCILAEADKPRLIASGAWQATAPGDGRTAGFHLSALYSPFETWGEIAREFVNTRKDPARAQVWTNTKLGETWEDEAGAPVLADDLAARAEEFGAVALPAAIRVLTAGVDTQNDRLEVEIVGWGIGEESWSLAYEVLWGDPAKPEVWEALDAVLTQRFASERPGVVLSVAATAIDSGGHRTPEVIQYATRRAGRRVWAIKGRGGPGIPPWPKRPPKPGHGRSVPVFIVGVDGLKTALYARLRLLEAGPGFAHTPADRDLDWFRGLTAERPVRRWHNGVAKTEWIVPDRAIRNEPLDARVYATAALHGLYASGLRIEAIPEPTAPAAPKVNRSSWMAR